MSNPTLVGVTAAGLALASLVALGATVVSARSTESGDVYRPIQAISYELGSKRAVGYFRKAKDECVVTLMIAEVVDPELARPTSAAKLGLSMLPGQKAGLASEEGESMLLTCGQGADTVTVNRASPARM